MLLRGMLLCYMSCNHFYGSCSLPDFFVRPDLSPKMYSAYGECVIVTLRMTITLTFWCLQGQQAP